MIRVLIAEDQGLVRDALARLLDREPDFEVVGQVASGEDAVAQSRADAVDVVLMDIELPGISGIEASRRIRNAYPGIYVAILTTFARPGYLRDALAAGASGFLLKEDPVPVLAANLRRILAGHRVVDPNLAVTALVDGPDPLTARERDILRAAADGEPIAFIARRLHLSEGTVRNHLSAVIQKLGVANRAQAVRRAEEHGWI